MGKDEWTTPKSTIKCKKKTIIEQCLEPTPYYDKWNEKRDGHRGYKDRTKIKPLIGQTNEQQIIKDNQKNKTLIKRRKLNKKRKNGTKRR